MKKSISIALAIIMLSVAVVFAGCSGGNADSIYQGNYVAVCGEMLGITMGDDDMSGFEMELKAGGKADMVINGESYSVSWTNDDKNITVNVDGVDLVGKIGKDTISFEDMLGMGMDVTFAKEGTDAANPENYLPEEEKEIIGKWVSKKVTDVLNDPVDDVAQDALKFELKADHTATIVCGDVDLGSGKWSLYSGFGSFDELSNADDDDSITFNVEDGKITVAYSVGEDYYKFDCEKE